MSELLPEPLGPTSAVVEPAGAQKDTSLNTGTPGTYSKLTSRSSTLPSSASSVALPASVSSSVGVCMISRMRSSPANASLICVPIDAICTSGAAMSPTKNTYMMNPPRVIVPARMARPPTMIMRTPISPTITAAPDPTADVPVMVFAMLRKSLCTPRAKTSRSRRSAT